MVTLVSPGSKEPVEVTVFIPTYNGDKYLDRLLSAVEAQEYDGTVEILIIDSGSTDRTLDIIGRHPSVRLVQIPNSEFGHGKTRNKAAELARGTYIAYLSHDAIPVGTHWLSSLISPLKPAADGGSDVQAVFGKHVARPDCFPLLKYGIAGVFAGCGPDGEVTIVDGAARDVSQMTPSELFYSDVCSATAVDFLTSTIAYQDLPYSEDLAFAKDVLAAGYRKAYQPSAVVEHSNDVTREEYPLRTFDEFLGMRRIGEAPAGMSWLGMLARVLKDLAGTKLKVMRDSDYTLVKKLYWSIADWPYVWGKWTGIYRALNVSLDDEATIVRYSLEAQRSAN